MTVAKKNDRRIDRTRQQLFAAFAVLVLKREYDRMTVADIAQQANVGRSTFYEHFESKDDILEQSLSRIFAALADTVGGNVDLETLRFVVDHLWENRKLASAMIVGSTRSLTLRMLSNLFESRLRSRVDGARRGVPLRMIADHLAGAQLALLAAWFENRTPCGSEQICRALNASANASASALLAI